MKILFLTQYGPEGASSRIFVYQLLSGLAQEGLDCTVAPLIPGTAFQKTLRGFSGTASLSQTAHALTGILKAYATRLLTVWNANQYDAVVVQKDTLPFGLGTLLRLRNPNYFFILDDPMWLPQTPRQGQWGIAGLVFRYRWACIKKLIQHAKRVLVDNPKEKEFLSQYQRQIDVFTAPIDCEAYQFFPKPVSSVPIIGWIGTPSTSPLLQNLLPTLEVLFEKTPFELHNIGGSPLTSTKIPIRNLAWSLETEKAQVRAFSIGLIPLDNSPYNEFKYTYKGAQYFAAGVPVLAEDKGLNREWVDDGSAGLLYRNSEEFLAAAKCLLEDSTLAQQLSQAGLAKARRLFDVKTASKRLASYLKCLAPAEGEAPNKEWETL